MAAAYDGDGNRVFQKSIKEVTEYIRVEDISKEEPQESPDSGEGLVSDKDTGEGCGKSKDGIDKCTDRIGRICYSKGCNYGTKQYI